MNHTCKESNSCCCSLAALEPDEDCPVHGWPWPPRCETCGRFLSTENRKKLLLSTEIAGK